MKILLKKVTIYLQLKEENEPLLCDNIHNNTVSYSNYSYSYPQCGHPKNYVFYKNINGIFFSISYVLSSFCKYNYANICFIFYKSNK